MRKFYIISYHFNRFEMLVALRAGAIVAVDSIKPFERDETGFLYFAESSVRGFVGATMINARPWPPDDRGAHLAIAGAIDDNKIIHFGKCKVAPIELHSEFASLRWAVRQMRAEFSQSELANEMERARGLAERMGGYRSYFFADVVEEV